MLHREHVALCRFKPKKPHAQCLKWDLNLCVRPTASSSCYRNIRMAVTLDDSWIYLLMKQRINILVDRYDE